MASRSFIDYLLNPGPDEVPLAEAIRAAAGVADDIAAAFVAIDAAVAATAADVVTINAQVTYIDGVVAEFNTDAAAALAAIATERASALTAIGAASTSGLSAINTASTTAIATVEDARDDAIAATDAGVATIATAVTDAQAALNATGTSLATDLNIIKGQTENLRDEAETARDEAVAAAASVAIPVIVSGDAGRVLTVKLDESGSEWLDAGVDLPAGGTTGQFLRKQSATEQDADWDDLPEATALQAGIISLPEVESAVRDAFAPRIRLNTARTYYVRTDGSDANTGLVNNAGGAFLTIQKAINEILWNVDSSGYDVTIQVGAGTRTEMPIVRGPMVGGGKLFIVGDLTTPANCYMNTTGNCFSIYDGAVVDIAGFKSTSGLTHVYCVRSKVRVGVWAFAGGGTCVETNPDGVIEVYANISITGAYTAFAHTPEFGGSIVMGAGNNITVTLTGTPSWSAYFIGTAGGKFTSYPATVTYVGAATGTRAYAHSNGIINCGGDTSRTYLPGNGNIVEQSGGRYLGFEGMVPACLGAQLPNAASNAFNSYIMIDCSTMTIGASANGGGSGYARVTSNGTIWKVAELLS